MRPIPEWLVMFIRIDAWVLAVVFSLSIVAVLARLLTDPAWFDAIDLTAFAFILFHKIAVLRYVRGPR